MKVYKVAYVDSSVKDQCYNTLKEKGCNRFVEQPLMRGNGNPYTLVTGFVDEINK